MYKLGLNVTIMKFIFEIKDISRKRVRPKKIWIEIIRNDHTVLNLTDKIVMYQTECKVDYVADPS